MPTVTRFAVTPVKSMRLHHPDSIRLEPFGVAVNRRFYIADPDGRMVNGTKIGPVVRIRAEYDPEREHLELHLPGGEALSGDAAAVGEAVSANFYGREVSGRILDGPWARALSDFTGRPLVLVRPDEPGAASDSAPVSLYSVASAEELDRKAGAPEPLDRRRWRMLVEVDGIGAHEEDGWIGGTVRLGDATIRVSKPVARCVITTQDPDTGIPDADTLGTIRRYRGRREGSGLDFGVYAEVLEPGTVRVGDPVEPLD